MVLVLIAGQLVLLSGLHLRQIGRVTLAHILPLLPDIIFHRLIDIALFQDLKVKFALTFNCVYLVNVVSAVLQRPVTVQVYYHCCVFRLRLPAVHRLHRIL